MLCFRFSVQVVVAPQCGSLPTPHCQGGGLANGYFPAWMELHIMHLRKSNKNRVRLPTFSMRLPAKYTVGIHSRWHLSTPPNASPALRGGPSRSHCIASVVTRLQPQSPTRHHRIGLSDVALATRTLSVASNGGYGIVNALEKSASILREREHVAHERHAQTAQIRLSTAVLSWIPLVICAWVITQQSHTRTFLLYTPLGLLCIVVGLLFNLAGRKWITRIAHNST
jgi:hypothetical protein